MLCPRCGAEVGEVAAVCEACRAKGSADIDATTSEYRETRNKILAQKQLAARRPAKVTNAPAGFWLRFLALFIDASALALLVLGIDVALPLVSTGVGVGLAAVALSALFPLLYFPLFESSSLRATPGKLIVGIEALSLEGKRLSFMHALARHVARLVPVLPMIVLAIAGIAGAISIPQGFPSFSGVSGEAVGVVLMICLLLSVALTIVAYPMAGFTAEKRALHDFIAKTNVFITPACTSGRLVVAIVIAVSLGAASQGLGGEREEVKQLDVTGSNQPLVWPTAPPSRVRPVAPRPSEENSKFPEAEITLPDPAKPIEPVVLEIPEGANGIITVDRNSFILVDYAAAYQPRWNAVEVYFFELPITAIQKEKIAKAGRVSVVSDARAVMTLRLQFKPGEKDISLPTIQSSAVSFSRFVGGSFYFPGDRGIISFRDAIDLNNSKEGLSLSGSLQKGSREIELSLRGAKAATHDRIDFVWKVEVPRTKF